MGLTRIRAEQISDIDFKQAVRVVTTTNITLSGSAPTVVDGVTLAANNRVLVAGQATASQNGIYVVTTLGTGSNGTWTRSTDANATGEIEAGMIVMVTDGTIYADTQWVLATNNPIVVGVTELSFQQNITNTGNVSAGSSGIRVLANSNVLVSVSGTANVATFAADGLYVSGNITSGNLAVGNDVVITGNLTVNGNTTTINSNVVTTNDKSITLANNQSTGANVDGSGIDVGSNSIATWKYNNATTSWQSNIAVTPAANATLELGGSANYWSTVYANTASLAGNVVSTGAVISTINATTISAAGNVTGSYILGNGALLSGVITSVANINSGTSNVTVVSSGGNITASVGGTSNVAVWATTGEYVTGVISATGNITGLQFVGNGAPLTNVTGANVTGTVANATYAVSAGSATTATSATSATTATTAGTVTSNAQANITSVGTLTSLSVSGNTTSGNLLTGGSISAAGNITGLNLFGTIQTGSQLNITQLGVLSSLNATGNVTGGNINTSGLISATGAFIGASLSVSGNITASGNINYTNVTDLVVGDPLIYIGANNTTNLVDLGIVASANVSGAYQHTGLVRDHNTNIWRLFSNVAAEPTTVIDWANSVYAPFAAGAITSNSTISASGNITASQFVGNGAPLTTITGANVTGTVPLATTSTYVTGLTSSNVTTALTYTPSQSSTSTNSIYSKDSRNTNYLPSDRAAGFYADFIANSTDGLSDGGTYHGVLTFRSYGSGTDYSGGQAQEIATTDNNNLWHRMSSGASTWGSWIKILDSNNYNSYAPTLTGTGASGSWGINITGSASTVTTASQPNITSVGTLTSATVSGAITVNSSNGATAIVNGGTAGVGNIGSSGQGFNTIFAKATSAQYADLAEMYVSDVNYKPGTVVEFGGQEEITQSTSSYSTAIAGVISTNPSYIMNAGQQGTHVLPVAFTGRVPCQVQGPVSKGDVLVSSNLPGTAQRIGANWVPGCVIGKSLGTIADSSVQTIEVVVGRF